MKLNTAFFIILALFAFQEVNAQSEQVEQEPVDTSDWETYSNPIYSIRYPSLWKFEGKRVNQVRTKFMIWAPLDSAEDVHPEYIVHERIKMDSGDVDLDKLANLYLWQLKQSDSSYVLHKNLSVKRGEDCRILEFSVIAGEQRMPMRIIRYIWYKDDTAYLLTFMGEESGFPAYEATVTAILDSFTLH